MTARSQCASIAAHLAKPSARLTSLDALRLYGCSRAAARVDEYSMAKRGDA
jgi:hypothetical protein